ncbi:MAG TPA: agmatine deiminase family protein [Caulobacteraceae bacterium]|nr:agmatine deiminase family protein [Caulobacteraceae bacterium]
MSPVPAEWATHRAMWVGFPSHEDLWEDNLAAAQAEVAALARALAGPGRETVRLMVAGDAAARAAEVLLAGTSNVEIVPGAFGDIWLRDTGPIFTSPASAAAFRFNGWGGKYELPGDETVADQIAAHAGGALQRHDFVLEGGALDHDGQGTALTTRQCLLNPNRNPGWREGDAERALSNALGVRRVLWLGEGLMNDHTDGHVDNLARFVAPGVVACPAAYGLDDPNAAAYDAAAQALAGFVDASGAPLKVVRIPSPGRLMDANHRVTPASHMNFLIANGAVIVPTYGDPAGAWAVQALQILLPGRDVIGLPATALLSGGGAFHCISQQEIA